MSLYWSPKQVEEYQAKLAAQKKFPVRGEKKQNPPPLPARAKEEEDLKPYSPSDITNVPVVGWQGKQSKTEEKYNRDILGGKGRFEAVCLYLPGGGRYTPDFMTIEDGVITFHEVKGSYRLQSQGRAWTAFKEACSAFPMWRFVWAHWTGKVWEQKTFESSAINRKGE
jgi:hypothetical protein